jgi:hypothetical protein
MLADLFCPPNQQLSQKYLAQGLDKIFHRVDHPQKTTKRIPWEKHDARPQESASELGASPKKWTIDTRCSREAAKECSPGRKPWVELWNENKPRMGEREEACPG